jgi:general secretion pathway protein G
VPGTFSQYEQGRSGVIDRRSVHSVEVSPGEKTPEQAISGSNRRMALGDQFSTDVMSVRVETPPTREPLYHRVGDARREHGFTLIELLVVIVVLGILAAVVIFALTGVTAKTAVGACQADGATIASAISVFNNQNPGTTVTIGELVTGTSSLGGQYVSSWPSNGTHYGFGMSAGTLIVQAPWASASGTYPSATGAGIASGIAYTGPTSCTGVN